MTTDNFCFYLQNRLIQTSHTGGQWYSDIFPFSIIPWKSYLRQELQGPFSQNYIFFVTYEFAKKAGVLHYMKAEMLVSEKHTSLLGPFISYEENEVL